MRLRYVRNPVYLVLRPDECGIDVHVSEKDETRGVFPLVPKTSGGGG